MGNTNFRNTKCQVISFTPKKSDIYSPDKNTKMLMQEIKALLSDPAFDNNLILNHVLNKICLLTESEFGCICKVDCNARIYRYAMTNILWDKKIQHERFPMVTNGTTFEKNDETEQDTVYHSYINNHYEDTEDTEDTSFSASNQPVIKRYMSIRFSNRPKGALPFTLYVCNKLDEFTKKDVIQTASLLSTVSHLFKREVNPLQL